MDTRLKLLSHSSICSLHSCPRRLQLTRLWPEWVNEDTVDTVYGRMFGEGLQSILTGIPLEKALVGAATQWSLDLYEFKKEKSFWHCWQAIERFAWMLPESPLADYEMVWYNGKPATELSFCIALPDGFYYRGFIDAVLRHRHSGEYLVMDAKTSGMNHSNPAKYQNSGQVLGYSVVMDKVAPGCQSFNVMYYEYLTYLEKFVAHDFVMDYLDRAMWIRDLLLDIEVMKMYGNYAEWPKHGEHCVAYGRVCRFIDNCGMQTAHLLGTYEESQDALELDLAKRKGIPYDINVTLEELIESQMTLGQEVA